MSRTQNSASALEPASWSDRYGACHRLQRVLEFPAGIEPPRKVRLYRRRDHYVLQWWDKREKRTLNERVEGDLVSAIARAREIDERLANVNFSGRKSRRIRHDELVERFVADLHGRADAGEIDVATVDRYQVALRHYLDFTGQPGVSRRYRDAAKIDRTFRLEFTTYLGSLQVSENGRAAASPRPMRRPDYVLDVVRAMLEWAADAERGNLLPAGLPNPFAKGRWSRPIVQDPVGDPDITVPMAVNLICACGTFQLRIFAPLVLYGLRPGELGWLFNEHVDDQWLRVSCLTELDYVTKGRRDKRFPTVSCIKSLWQVPGCSTGLVYRNRGVVEGRRTVALADMSLAALVEEYQMRCAKGQANSAASKRRVRKTLMKHAGQLNYDHVEGEFDQLARRLDWPRRATLKDLRHLFSTSLENAGVPEFYRRYFMGHSFGKAPIVAYTHLASDKLQQHYQKALDTELAPLVNAIERRTNQLTG